VNKRVSFLRYARIGTQSGLMIKYSACDLHFAQAHWIGIAATETTDVDRKQ